MLSIEEYIARRKKEDKLNEFDNECLQENMKNCVNYVFEYFNQYLDIKKMEEQTILNEDRLNKYRKQLNNYEEEIQEWLVSIYNEYDKQINRSIVSFLKKDKLFLLYHKDSEFRSISYECYAHLIKSHPYLKNQTEMLFLFIKDFHRLQSQFVNLSSSPFISMEINEWLEKSLKKYSVNILTFASEWVNFFYDNEELWPVKHRQKSKESWRKYEYDIKQKNNLFNLNSLYTKIRNKPFIKGKKQELEILMMYFWLYEIVGDPDNYWDEYLNKVLLDK
ncbi:hypothetical protein [Priestia megaterium]|uniref:hypothetical protein n=1 Tax=Priestia megaterium TaxID=1404 RepID=UPI001C23BBB7|nr:hypothetical protein [Priestia megaterium]MBU8852757.1 hypothetical protein [Bacillus sp. FJAT-26377]MCU7738873.1 hypothetical protein [Priestia megaterium]